MVVKIVVAGEAVGKLVAQLVVETQVHLKGVITSS